MLLIGISRVRLIELHNQKIIQIIAVRERLRAFQFIVPHPADVYTCFLTSFAHQQSN